MLRKFSYANVIATLALFLALGGVGYAAATIGSGAIIDNSIRGKDIHQKTIRGGDVRKNTLGGKQIKESKLGTVPNAAKLGGAGPEAFLPAGTLVRYSFTLAGGEVRDVVSHGSLKLVARCIDNGEDQAGNAARDVARLYVTNSQNGAVLSGVDQLDGGGAGFLNNTTPETDAVWSENSVPDATEDGIDGSDDDLAMVSAADGSTISGLRDQAIQGVNVYGAACAFRGWVVVQ